MKHLSQEQISRWVLGDLTDEETQHVRECAECGRQFTELRETLSLFRDSVNEWAEQEHQTRIPEKWSLQAVPHQLVTRPFRWALITALLLVIAAVPVYREVQARQQAVKEREDAILMEKVNEQVSRMVPAPIEPWLELLSNVRIEESGGHQ
jgi:hypothetical protein